MTNKQQSSRAIRSTQPTDSMSMSTEARARMRMTEKAVYRYYNDMGKERGNCTWGAGILAHKGVCSEEELGRKVSEKAVDGVFARNVAEAERIVRSAVHVALKQAQFDALCSLAFNAGPRGTRDTFGFVNRNDFTGAAINISKMIKVTYVEKGKKMTVVAPDLSSDVRKKAHPSASRLPASFHKLSEECHVDIFCHTESLARLRHHDAADAGRSQTRKRGIN